MTNEPPAPVAATDAAFNPNGRRFDGRSCLVTGAASGIGAATALRLASEGANVMCADVDLDGAQRTADSVATVAGAAPGRMLASRLDVSSADSVAEVVAATVSEFGGLDVVCNVAGILQFASFEETTLDDWQRILDVNLTGTFLMCKAAMDHLLASGGNIVNVASTAALAGHPWCSAYSASKGGIVALTQTIAVEFGRRGVRCNAIAPGSIETPIQRAFRFPDGADKSLLNRIMPLDTMRSPSHVAALIAFVASSEGAHCNGSVLRIDSGTLS